jgi:predicted transcriptional regulator
MADPGDDHKHLLALTVQIASAFVAGRQSTVAELPELLRTVHAALRSFEASVQTERPAAPPPPRDPAVPIERSITPDYLICLEDGRRLKTLKRHLRAAYGLTPEAYRARWGLPPDYPMVAPGYARRRSSLAKAQGLGRTPREG